MLWYSLEVPQWGASNEYQQDNMFLWKYKKNIYLCAPLIHYKFIMILYGIIQQASDSE